MLFPWHKYEELPISRRNTLQVFITNKCNLNCKGCFARFAMKDNSEINLDEYKSVIKDFLSKGGKQINILGGEPLLHPKLKEILDINRKNKIKTTIYTNGYFLNNYNPDFFRDIKLRLSLYCKSGLTKAVKNLPISKIPFEVCFMVSRKTSVEELLDTANEIETKHSCKVFFISSIRELDNPNKEFFEDTKITLNLLKYKQLVHEFLERYEGSMDIHISKRGVFESTKYLADNKCAFANYFIGGKIIQCPYDVVNLKFQKDYQFQKRHCQHNNACLMSKIILRRKSPIA